MFSISAGETQPQPPAGRVAQRQPEHVPAQFGVLRRQKRDVLPFLRLGQPSEQQFRGGEFPRRGIAGRERRFRAAADGLDALPRHGVQRRHPPLGQRGHLPPGGPIERLGVAGAGSAGNEEQERCDNSRGLTAPGSCVNCRIPLRGLLAPGYF